MGDRAPIVVNVGTFVVLAAPFVVVVVKAERVLLSLARSATCQDHLHERTSRALHALDHITWV